MLKTLVEAIVIVSVLSLGVFAIDSLIETNRLLKGHNGKFSIIYDNFSSLSYLHPEYTKYEKPFKAGL
jgi:hypothetical protein